MESIVDVALATRYATLEAIRAQPALDLRAKIKTALPLRAALLSTAEALAATGYLRLRDVEAIRRGRGWQDSAADLVALADLFAAHAKAIKGKHAITPAMLKDAREIGSFLLANLRSERTKKSKATDGDAVGIRNRLWSMLVDRHQILRKAAYYLYGDAFEAHVPSLQSHRRGKAAKKAAAKSPSPSPAA